MAVIGAGAAGVSRFCFLTDHSSQAPQARAATSKNRNPTNIRVFGFMARSRPRPQAELSE
jgi:hypothetical protein